MMSRKVCLVLFARLRNPEYKHVGDAVRPSVTSFFFYLSMLSSTSRNNALSVENEFVNKMELERETWLFKEWNRELAKKDAKALDRALEVQQKVTGPSRLGGGSSNTTLVENFIPPPLKIQVDLSKVRRTAKKPHLEDFEEEEESVSRPSKEGVRSVSRPKRRVSEGGVVKLTREEEKQYKVFKKYLRKMGSQDSVSIWIADNISMVSLS
jgi:hypothetical protein